MRVLLACSLGGAGHLLPLAAAGRALRGAGHDVILLAPPSVAERAADTGLRVAVGGEPPHEVVDGIWDRVRAGPAEVVAGLIDRELFAGHGAQAMLEPARELQRRWRPHMIVREPCEYASAVVAHDAGLPQAQVAISLSALEWSVLAMVSPILSRLGAGLPAAIRAAPYLTPFPPTLDDSPWPDTRRFRHEAPAAAPATQAPDTRRFRHDTLAAAPAAQAPKAAGRPLVYVTFGSVLGQLPEARSVWRAVLDAVAPLAVTVLATVGRGVDPAGLGSVPGNVRLERWVPQETVLPHADLVVCHGGSGTVLGALAAGVPLVICPLFADQPINARLIEQAGAGRVLTARADRPGALGSLESVDVAPLREAIAAVLGDPAHARAAEALSREMGGLPPLADALALEV